MPFIERACNLAVAMLACAILQRAAQGQQIVVGQPDCVIFFRFTAAAQTSPLSPNAGFSNLTNGCTTWNLSYANSGFSALSLVMQSAPNNNGVAGIWGTFAGATLLAGVNPNTNTTGAFTWLTGYNPWVRVQLASATGTGEVDGAVYGYRIPSAGTVSGATTPITGTVTANQGTAGSQNWPVDGSGVTQPISGSVAAVAAVGPAASGIAPGQNPIQTVGLGSGATGGLLYQPTACDSSAPVSVNALNSGRIVLLAAGQSIHVCSFSLSISAAGRAIWIAGTGSTCGTGPVNLTGPLYIASGSTLALGSGHGQLFKTPVGDSLCLSAFNGNVRGVVSYAVY
jgi:hypothetical protein